MVREFPDSMVELLLLGIWDTYFPVRDIYQELLSRLAKRFPGRRINLVYLDHPPLLTDFVRPGACRYIILPLLLAMSSDQQWTISSQIAELKAVLPDVQITLLPPVSESPSMLYCLEEVVANAFLVEFNGPSCN